MDQTYDKIMVNINKQIENCMRDNPKELDEERRMKIFGSLNLSFKNNMGILEYDKFCNFLTERNMKIFIGSKDYTLYVCFYNGITYYTIEHILKEFQISKVSIGENK